MTSDFINKIIARSNQRILIWSLIGIAILVAAGVLASNYLYNFVSGPFTVDSSVLEKANSLNDLEQKWITVKGDDTLIDTGYQYVSTSDSGTETVEDYYLALPIGNKLLIVKSPKQLSTDTVTGGLWEMSSDEQEHVINDIAKDYPGVKDSFMPFVLDTASYRQPGFIGLAVAAVILLLSLFGLFTWISRSSNPLNHPIMKGLKRFGDPQATAGQIEMEMVGDPVTAGKLRFTRSWLFQATNTTFKAMRLNDVMWIHKQVTQRRTNGIPSGKSYAVMIYDRYGTIMTVPAKDKQVDEMIQGVVNRAPWVIAGYNLDIQNMWKSNRQNFIATVDQRRKDGASGTGSR